MPTPSNTTPGSAHSSRRGKFAKARIERNLTYAMLNERGFTNETVSKADRGILPRNKFARTAYLSLLGMKEADA